MNSRTKTLHAIAMFAVTMLPLGSAAGDGLLPMTGAGGADVVFDEFCTTVWVDVSGYSEPFFPGGEGAIVVLLERSVQVTTPPKAGRVNLNCHGHLPLGGQALALDVITGQFFEATLATMDEACDAVAAVFPDICRGPNGPFVTTFETTGLDCFVTVGGTDYLTQDSVGITTRNGASSLNCHFDLDAALSDTVGLDEAASPRVVTAR